MPDERADRLGSELSVGGGGGCSRGFEQRIELGRGAIASLLGFTEIVRPEALLEFFAPLKHCHQVERDALAIVEHAPAANHPLRLRHLVHAPMCTSTVAHVEDAAVDFAGFARPPARLAGGWWSRGGSN